MDGHTFPQTQSDDLLWPQSFTRTVKDQLEGRILELEAACRALLAPHPNEQPVRHHPTRPVWQKFAHSAAGWMCIICERRLSHESWCPVPMAQSALEEVKA